MAIVEQVETQGGGRRRLGLSNPATLESVGAIEVQTAADVARAVERARKAQPAWAELGIPERARYLERAVRVLLARQEAFIDVICGETGKPRMEALATEILTACDALQFYAKRARRILADRTVPVHLLKSKKLKLCYRPLGVVGIITPWNFPFILSLNPTAQALIAGNAVVLKPSEITPFSGRLVEQLFQEAGLPDGVFQLVQGDGETGAALVEAEIDKLSFTGSVRTGRKVGEICGRRLIPCTLELGGKDPMIVCADADLRRAARGAVYGAFANSGQVCTSTERVYVVADVAEEFTRRVLEETARLRQGSSGEFDVGSITCPQQLEIIESHVADAVARGARVLAGGRRNPAHRGLFYEPTVLDGVNHQMRIMREETFGPVLPIMCVADEAEGLRLANDSGYGLNASIFTGDRRHGVEMARAIESGCVVVNDCMLTYGVPESPFGGIKESGIGRVNGEMGLRSYCNVQSILIDRVGSQSEPLWYPYSARKLSVVQRAMKMLWGTPLGRLIS